ncbi:MULTISPECIES: hypothetical protein [unclassified Luteimonas]
MTRQSSFLLLTALTALMLAPVTAQAAGSRTGVHPQHGEMVLLRNVNARPAYRPAPPSVALIVDPRPSRELHAGLGTGEMSDADFAAISSGHSLGPARPASGIDGTVNNAISVGLGTGQVQHSGAVGGSVGGALSGPLGTVGTTTRGIGSHVTGAMSQFPLGKSGPGGP